MAERSALVLVLVLAACGPKRTEVGSPVGEVVSSSVDTDRALAVLEAGAADLDPAVRRRALVYLYDSTRGVEARAWALRALWDPNPWVQRGAIEAIAADLPDPAARELLVGVVARQALDPYVRCGAALRLAVAGDTSTLPEVGPAWRDEAEGWRAAPCALAAAAMGDGEAATALAGILREGELPLELGFFADLGASGLDGLGTDLAAADELLDESVHVALADALLRLDPPAGTDLFRRLLDGPEIERMEGIDFLLDLPSTSAIPLLERVDDGGSARLRHYVALALLVHGEADASAVEDAMASDDREIRALAVRCAGLALQRGVADDEPRLARTLGRALFTGLADDEDVVRMEAATAIARSGARGDTDALQALLSDEQTALRVEAAGALLAIRRQG